jgi:hypothetical protein
VRSTASRSTSAIFDGTRVTARPSALVRKSLADYTRDSGPRSKLWAVGTAIVVPNALLRGVMTAIHRLSPPKISVEALATYDEAVGWCHAKLAAAGVSPPWGGSGPRRAG